MNQENEIEVLGFWWVLGHSEEKFPGLLKYSKTNGIKLEIFQNEPHEKFNHKVHDIIVGLVGSQNYTLLSSRNSGHKSSLATNSVEYYTFESSTLVECAIPNKHSFCFNSMNILMENTYNFFGGFESYNIDFEDYDRHLENTIITPNHQQVDFNINELLKGSIDTKNIIRQGKSFEIIGQVWFNVESKDKSLVPFNTLLEQMNYFRIFFSLIMQGICIYDKMTVHNSIIERGINVYLKNTFGATSKRFMMFDYSDVKDNFSTVLENWFRLSREIPEVLNLFYNTYTSTSFYEYHFKEIYVALEGLYKWKFNSDTNGDLVPSFINPLMIERKIAFPTFCKIVNNYKIWGDIARKNRIFHMHLEKIKHKDDLVDNVGLLQLMRKIQAIILFYILEELGFSDEEIEAVFRRLEVHFIPIFF
jgi:hypothetical protein